METDWKELAIESATALRKMAYAARYRHDVNKALVEAETALENFREHWNAEARQRRADAKEETDGGLD